jgi:hypothetical protein
VGVDFTEVTISTTDIFIYAGIILAAIGAIWGIKKMINLVNGDDEMYVLGEVRDDNREAVEKYNQWAENHVWSEGSSKDD